MKLPIRILLLTGLLSMVMLQCKNPLQDIEVNVNADIIRYSAIIDLREATGAEPAGLSVSVTGDDKDAVYDLGGSKKLSVVNGMISIGLDPRTVPTAAKPVKFNLVITGSGYLPLNVPVIIGDKQLQQIRSVKMMKVSAPPQGGAVVEKSTNLTNGAIAAPLTVTTPATNGKTESGTVTLPANTTFKDAAGKAITGTAITVSMAHFDISTEQSIAMFPGGSLSASNVIGPGNKTSAVTFLPAGFMNVDMTIGTTQVREFNQPISLSMQISSDYQNTANNAKVKAGDVLGVYSYQVETGQWKFESNTTVALVSGKLEVTFPTTHLTWFMVGQAVDACTQGLTINFNAPWAAGKEHPVRMEIKMKGADTYKMFNNEFSLTDAKSEIVNILPNKPLTLTVYNTTDGQILAITDIANPCGQAVTVNVAQPGPLNPEVTMKLTVKCPGKVAVSPPDFFFYYKETGKNEPFKLLGLVTGGAFKTRVLKTKQAYDFRAVWGTRTKTVVNKTVTESNVMEVSDKNYGQNKGNLNILIEECK